MKTNETMHELAGYDFSAEEIAEAVAKADYAYDRDKELVVDEDEPNDCLAREFLERYRKGEMNIQFRVRVD